ncbi:MAG TPA: TRAP transporter TatT component family protein [Anaeromyxobacteraceae bacterium]|nr:TRAP transporter TatT component family protein [Anaeromyxobacteraceae bacterium]
MNKRLVVALTSLAAACAGCSAAASYVAADAITGDSSRAYVEDDDPELVRQAVPFGLKTMETLLEQHPNHQGLLTSLASGFTQYSYAFVQSDADEAEAAGKMAAARVSRDRARRLFLRARDYGLHGLEVRHKGISGRLEGARDLDPVVAQLNKDDVRLVYWTAASWALAIAAGKDDMALVAQLPAPGALMRRALTLDEAFDEGAIHEFFISWEAAQGGGEEAFRRSREHFERALVLSGGRKLGPYVAYAEAVVVPRQDRAEFNRLLQHVLTYDVESDKAHRLANVLAQRRARFLLSRADDLFS